MVDSTYYNVNAAYKRVERSVYINGDMKPYQDAVDKHWPSEASTNAVDSQAPEYT